MTTNHLTTKQAVDLLAEKLDSKAYVGDEFCKL